MFTNLWHASWDLSTPNLFLKSTNFIFLQDNMAPKNATSQASRKAIWSTSQGSTTDNTAFGRIMTRSMAKVVATITIGESVVTFPLQHIKFRFLTPKFLMESTKLLLLLWSKSLSPASTCRKWYLTGWMNFKLIPTLLLSPLVFKLMFIGVVIPLQHPRRSHSLFMLKLNPPTLLSC